MERNHAPCRDTFVFMKYSRPETVELTSALWNHFVKCYICKNFFKNLQHKQKKKNTPTLQKSKMLRVFSTSETVQV